MKGQQILARTMSLATRRGKGREAWQYHSRSDAHSKVACWTLLFDALCECDVLRKHATEGRLGFGVNYEMVGPISKRLDLVLTRVPPRPPIRARDGFLALAERFGIALDESDREELDAFPMLLHDHHQDDSEIVVALEAKACMTEHVKALPRLHAEILATGYLAKRAMPRCITVSYTLVNSAPTFRTPSASHKVNEHAQPDDAGRVVEMLAQAIPLARDLNNLIGYDVIGVSIIDCRNDGSPVSVDTGFPWPRKTNHITYERLVRNLCSEYRARAGA
jgi:hypothetical protein